MWKKEKVVINTDSVVGYCRVSSENGNEESQKKDLVSWSRINKIHLASTFSECITGTSPIYKRPVLFSAISYCRINGIDTIAVQNLGVFGSMEPILPMLINISRRYGIKFYCLEECLTISDDMKRSELQSAKKNIRHNEKQMRRNLKLMDRGRRIAMKNGVKMGRKRGSCKTDEQFREEYSDVLEALRKGISIRETSRRTGVSASTVQRLKKRFSI